ncbi:MAG: homoserine dehydrogenase [Deltaproteobacteria bacterium]|nr:MAG: homoserine dehydrogenase [Deltaproteobacteria bacterium]
MRDHIGVGVIGFGTVGVGAVRILMENRDVLRRRTGFSLDVVRIADLDLETDRGISVDPEILTRDAHALIADPDVDIVVELIGGYEPAASFIKEALEQGKYVVTANKALLATRGWELFEAADRNGASIAFEASVGGGIPILRSVREGLCANRFRSIHGILNGTANYILTQMSQTGMDFEDALKEAQQKGYAEADPTFDIEGIDAAHKITILSTMAFGVRVPFEAVSVKGIKEISQLDVLHARELGLVIKLLAIGVWRENELEIRVQPTMIPESHMLAKVDGVYNAIHVIGDFVGSTLYYGKGAGMNPTGSAVVSDIVSIARQIAKGTSYDIPPLGAPLASFKETGVCDAKKIKGTFYLRMMTVDRPGVLSKISGILGEKGISLASVIQKGEGEEPVAIVMVTHETTQFQIDEAIQVIDHLDVVMEPTLALHIETELK